MSCRILLTGPAISPDSVLETEFAGIEYQTDIVPDSLNPGLLDRVAHGDFDGVVCGADGPVALQIVNRLRTQNGKIPILLVSKRDDPAFETRALDSGVTSVVFGDLAVSGVSRHVSRMMGLKLAALKLQDKERINEHLRRDLAQAGLIKKTISQSSYHLNQQWLRRGLLPLLIQNDPQEAFTLVKAFDRAEVYAPLPIMRSAQEALAYLQGTPPFENRNLNPLPNAILLDLTPVSMGVELLRWIRKQSKFAATPVIVLSKTADPDEVQESYGSLANSFLVKPTAFEELVSMIRAIDVYWTRMNIGRAF